MSLIFISLPITKEVPYANNLDLDEMPSYSASRRYIKIQAIWQSDNIFTNFEQLWSILKMEAD